MRPLFTCLLWGFPLFLPTLIAQSFPCGTEVLHQRALQDPVWQQKNAQVREAARQFFHLKSAGAKKPIDKDAPGSEGQNPPFLNLEANTIPVVFHLVHQNGPENLSDAQLKQALDWLNEAFANAGPFDRGSGANTGIQFCLAQRTPDGQNTNGITRTVSPLTELQAESEDGALKKLARWKPTDYLNIWVVREACSVTFGCGLTAYAYYPAFHGSSADGIVIEARWLTDAASMSLLAHETGHYLGLAHTFQGGCVNNDCLQDGDYVCDTPPDQSTAGIPCGQSANTCNTDTQSGLSTDQADPTQNHMDYGPYGCMHDFTPGQAERMRFFLESTRKSLLVSKGCLPPCPSVTVAALGFADTTIAAGTNFVFPNKSVNAAQYIWTLDGVVLSNQSTANYQFTVPGVYKIVLTALPTNPSLCETAKATGTIRVICDVEARFEVDKVIVKVGSPVQVTNFSNPNLQNNWSINGVVTGSPLGGLSFPSPGEQLLKLVVSNGFCRDSQSILITVRDTSTAGCTETTFQQIYPLRADTSYPSLTRLTQLTDGNLLIGGNLAKVIPIAGGGFTFGIPSAILIKKKPDGTQLWEKEISGGDANYFIEDVAASKDGGFYAIILTGAVATRRTCQLTKFNIDGIQQWSIALEDTDNVFFLVLNSSFKKLLVLPDNSVIIGGQFIQNLGFIKCSPTGQLLWSKHYKVEPNVKFNAMALLPDGSFVAIRTTATGYTLTSRFNAVGELLWDVNLGTNRQNIGVKIVPAADGAFYVVGSTNTGTTGAAWLAKISPEGALLWSNTYQSAGGGVNSPLAFNDVYVEPNGLTLVGSLRSQLSAFVRLTTDGQPLFVKTYGQVNSDLTDLIPTGKGGFWINGQLKRNEGFSSFIYPQFWLLKADPTGEAGECPTTLRNMSVASWPLTPTAANPPLQAIAPIPDSLGWTLPLVDTDCAATTICDIACANFEICNNNADDDGDGLFDCLDPDCNCPVAACEPKRNNLWYFSNRYGLDFSTEQPTYLTNGNTLTISPSSTMSDERGNLLFYTDGINVYDRFHTVMPNGTLTTAPAGTPGAECIIVPHPGIESQYYVFGIGPFIGDGLRYTIVDLRLNNGRGDVIADKKFLRIGPNSINRGMAAVRSCAFEGYWLVVHEFFSNRFFAYAIKTNGLDPTPVISSTGFYEVNSAEIYAQMKLSPDGKRIALAHPKGEIGLEIFDFDPYQTGIVNNPKLIMVPDSQVLRGVEFSPSGRFVYISIVRDKHAQVIQYDLEALDIAASAFLVGEELSGAFYHLQLTPRKEIYVAGSREYTIGSVMIFAGSGAILHQPDRPGAACEFEAGALAFQNTSWCNVIPSDFVSPYVTLGPDAPDTICDLGQAQYYRIPKLHCNVDSVQWLVEGVQANILDQYQQAFITYTSYGQGRLIVTAFTTCGTASDTLPILVAAPTNQKLDLGPDQVVCDNGVFTFNAGSGFARYRWNDGLPDSVLTTLLPGKYWVDVWDACGNKQSDTVTVRIAPSTRLDLGPDAAPCKNEPLRFDRPGIFQRWQWLPNQNLDCDTCRTVTVTPNKPLTFTVVATSENGCISVDTLVLSTRDTIPISIDTSICIGRRVVFYGQSLPADTVAAFLRPAPGGVGCDSLVVVAVRSEQTPQQRIEVSVCPGEFYRYRGQALPPDTTALFFHPAGALSCDTVVTVVTESYPPVVLSILPQDTTVFIGASVTLNAKASGTGPFQYIWTPAETLACEDCPAPLATPVDTTLYRLVATDANQCSSSTTAQVNVKEVCLDMVPNAFTPNGDDTNERFFPLTQPCVKKVLRWTVVNRWGQTVFERFNFEPNKPELGWDGSAHGQAQPMDGYVWFAEFELYNGKKVFKKGSVTLLR